MELKFFTQILGVCRWDTPPCMAVPAHAGLTYVDAPTGSVCVRVCVRESVFICKMISGGGGLAEAGGCLWGGGGVSETGMALRAVRVS